LNEINFEKMKHNLLFMALAILAFTNVKSFSQNVIVGGTMEDASKWTEVAISQSVHTLTFNYTANKPTGSTGGCLRFYGTGGNNAIYQQITLKKMVDYKADMLFKDQSSNLQDLWFQAYLRPDQPTTGNDFSAYLLKEFNTWSGCARGIDGLMSEKGCGGNGLSFNLGKTTGDTTVWFVIKWGSFSTNPYDLLIDNVTIEYSKVTGISIAKANPLVAVGQSLQMIANTTPANVFDNSVLWSVSNGTGSASIDNNGLLICYTAGTVIVKAVANDGSGIQSQLEINILDKLVLLKSISIEGEGGVSTITADKGTLQLQAAFLPNDASEKSVIWSLTNGTGKAIISSTGLVYAKTNGIVTVRASSQDGSNTFGEKVITLSNQITHPLFKVIPLGDSKTAGGNNANDQYSWRGILRAKLIENDYSIDYLGSQQQRAYGDIEPYDNDNCGYGGYTIGPDTYKWCSTCETIGIFEHIENWLNTAGDPDIIILSAGINDLLGNDADHPANFKATTPQRYRALVNRLLELRPKIKLIVCTVEPVRWDKNWGAKGTGLGMLNDTILAIANVYSNDNIFLADLYTDFMNTWDYNYFFDDVHMSQLGATRTASTIFNALVSVMDNTIPGQLVSTINVVGKNNANSINTSNGTLQMSASVLPETAVDQRISWSVVNTGGSAVIDQNGLLTAISDGTVTVRATAKDGSGIYGEIVVTINNQLTGLNSKKKITVSIFPNPVKNILNIRSKGKCTVTIIDAEGNILITKFLDSENGECNTESLLSGFYFVKVISDEGNFVEKLIKY
jgi:uncharacterized protein YjdB